MQCILADLRSLRDAGADGFVFGALTCDRQSVDITAATAVLAEANGLPVTFHRAFDELPVHVAIDEAKKLEQLGFARLLTSGCSETANDGIETIVDIMTALKGTMVVIPGAGINEQNIKFILEKTKCKEFHSSARSPCRVFDCLQPTYQADGKVVESLVSIGLSSLK